MRLSVAIPVCPREKLLAASKSAYMSRSRAPWPKRCWRATRQHCTTCPSPTDLQARTSFLLCLSFLYAYHGVQGTGLAGCLSVLWTSNCSTCSERLAVQVFGSSIRAALDQLSPCLYPTGYKLTFIASCCFRSERIIFKQFNYPTCRNCLATPETENCGIGSGLAPCQSIQQYHSTDLHMWEVHY